MSNKSMPICESTDIMYPLLADVYYPIIEQGAYGNIDRTWVLDATIACSFAPASSKSRQSVETQDVNIKIAQPLVGRTRRDIRLSSRAAASSITNVILTNIRDKNGNIIYLETAGERAGKATLFEIATNEPIVGAFGSTEYFRVVIRRSENQAVNV